MSRREILGFVAAACVACCIGPILAVLGAIAALGVGSTVSIGLAGLLVGAALIAAVVVVRRRRSSVGATEPETVPIERTLPSR